ncbi:MAG: DUF4153 domain-containing protein [Eubacterium sp.]|nr:DUF4153 domain-containing protein [Eubacterium sp.]
MESSENQTKGKFEKSILKIKEQFREVFRDYPLTMTTIIIASVIGAMLVDFSSRTMGETLERIEMFFFFLSFQELLLEEMFRKRKNVYWIGTVFAMAFSAFSVWLLSGSHRNWSVFQKEYTDYILWKVIVVYAVIAVCLSVHHMYTRTEEDFEVYCTKTMGEICKVTAIYGMFALGMAIIIWIYNSLILDTDSFLERIEIFLVGGVYAPMLLRAFSGKKKPMEKYYENCVLYVLQPMLLIAVAIIYLYIIKIGVMKDFSERKIFEILSWLFVLGMPIWTMAHATSRKEGGFYSVGKILPYLFCPLIVLQIYSMALRIQQCGFTIRRYQGLMLVVFEILYYVFYFLQLKGIKKAISWCLYVLIGICVVALWVPHLNYEDVVISSQIPRVIEGMEIENVIARERSVGSAYNEIYRLGYRGRKALNEEFSKEQLEKIKNYNSVASYTPQILYLNDRIEFSDIDVSQYRRIMKIQIYEMKNHDIAIVKIFGRDARDTVETCEVDIRSLIRWGEENYDEDNDYSFSIKGREMYSVDSGRDIFLTNISIELDTEQHEIRYIRGEGYLLEK